MMVFVDFCCILQHLPCILLQIVLHFEAFYLVFWCILHCILVHIALHFGAKCTAFWCILRCVLLQNALQQLAINLHFLVAADANLGEFSSKRNAKA